LSLLHIKVVGLLLYVNRYMNNGVTHTNYSICRTTGKVLYA